MVKERKHDALKYSVGDVMMVKSMNIRDQIINVLILMRENFGR